MDNDILMSIFMSNRIFIGNFAGLSELGTSFVVSWDFIRMCIVSSSMSEQQT